MNAWLRFTTLSATIAVMGSACGGVSSSDVDASVDATTGTGDAGEADADIDEPDAEPGLIPSTVFVTSTSQAPGFGSQAGADAVCNSLASDAGLAGNYIAWLSIGAQGAAQRMPTTRSWRRVDGALVADGLAALVSGALSAPISLDENGDAFQSSLGVYTGTLADGTTGIGDCAGWSGSSTESVLIGAQDATDITWTETAGNCGRLRALYCFEI